MSKSGGKGVAKRSNSQNGGAKDEQKRSRYDNGALGEEIFQLNPLLHDEAVQCGFKAAWESDQGQYSQDQLIDLSKSPFTHCSIHNLVQTKGESDLDNLIQELNDLQMVEKNNDLYKFRQSGDLKSEKQEMIQKFIHFLQTQLKGFLECATGMDLNDEIDLFCAKYNYTDYLLCHDDELEGRRIAFIWYLVPNSWNKADGGALDLFDTTPNGDPGSVAHSLVPAHNSLVFFEVTPQSFHQVNEVLTQDKTRLSVGGWFHGSTQPRPPRSLPLKAKPVSPSEVEEDVFFSWVNLEYVDDLMQVQIRQEFEDNSEISLQSFFDPEKYAQLSEVLARRDSGLQWSLLGPPNKRHYEALRTDEMTTREPILSEFIKLMQSDAMFLLLSNLTGIRLHNLASEDSDNREDEDENKVESAEEDDESTKPETEEGTKASGSKTPEESEEAGKGSRAPVQAKCSSEIRQWQQGGYTLVHDEDLEEAEFVLDAKVFFNCKDWTLECGGFSSYIEKDEDRELLSVQPQENTLMLVYRDNKTLRFVKRVTDEINHKASAKFQELSVTYYEK